MLRFYIVHRARAHTHTSARHPVHRRSLNFSFVALRHVCVCLHPGTHGSSSGAVAAARWVSADSLWPTIRRPRLDWGVGERREPERGLKNTAQQAAEKRADVPPEPPAEPRPPVRLHDERRRPERPGQLGAEAHRGDHPPAVCCRGAALTRRQRWRRQGKIMPWKPERGKGKNTRAYKYRHQTQTTDLNVCGVGQVSKLPSKRKGNRRSHRSLMEAEISAFKPWQVVQVGGDTPESPVAVRWELSDSTSVVYGRINYLKANPNQRVCKGGRNQTNTGSLRLTEPFSICLHC